jgi:glutamate-ammonia-ligase adenylyltransferase
MNAVHQEFDLLIGLDSPNHQTVDEHWVTLWHSRWSDQDSIAWLAQEEAVWQSKELWILLRNFRQDITKRSFGNRGRQVLDKLIPLLLCRLHRNQDAVKVLKRVLHVFNKILTRTAYLELLFENEGALKQLIHLCQASSWVTEYIAKYPILLDELIDPKLLYNPPKLCSYQFELREHMLRIPEEDLEAQMESLRQFKQSQQLRIAAAEIAEVLPVGQVSHHLTALAEAILAEVVSLAWQQVSDRFGVPCCCQNTKDVTGFGIIAYGKTGGTELGYNSDLDLVFVHQSSLDEVTTGRIDGNNSVPSSQFYLKLAQRIMHIFNTRMNSGILYELDMRLRPSGSSGLLVVHLNTFSQYQKEDAWTWEHQALVRARMIFGNQQLQQNFTNIRQQVLAKPRVIDVLKADVIAMREKMRRHLDKSDEINFDIKQGDGGLVDIEFLAQFMVLAYAASHRKLLNTSDNVGIYKALASLSLIEKNEQQFLTTAYQKLRAIGHKVVMQNMEQLAPRNEIDFTKRIRLIWRKYLY